jgi:acyl-CoA thioesterase-1
MNKSARGASKIDPMHSLIPFLFLGLTAVPALAKNPLGAATQNVSKTPTVLVLGDSLSAGYGLKKTQAYPALLSEKAQAAGQRLHVINAGVSGDTTAGGLRRLPHLLDQPIDVFIVELGINDIFRGVPVAQIEANLQKIIDLARAHSPQVRIVIAGMQLPQTAVNDSLTAFGQMYTDLARRNSAELVPFLLDGVAGNPNLNLPDMIHPNASGQKILASNVWPALASALKKS